MVIWFTRRKSNRPDSIYQQFHRIVFVSSRNYRDILSVFQCVSGHKRTENHCLVIYGINAQRSTGSP